MITSIQHTSIDTCLPVQRLPTTPMQTPHSSESDTSFSESEIPSGPIMHPPATGFQFTPEDKDVLNKYMDEFEQADTQMRNNIVEKVMGELYQFWPGNSGFDKKEAKQACILTLHMCSLALTVTDARKSKSGSTTATLLLIVGQPHSFRDGPQGMSSTMTNWQTSWSLPSKSPELLLALRNS
jgi:hypothetical protein